MDRLPYEILQEIFILLPQHQKLECMCVCHSWEKVIKDSCLFHTVLITTHENLDKLMRIFERTPSKGAHVKRLILYISHQLGDLVKSLLALFPNLKSFYYYGPMDGCRVASSTDWMDSRLAALNIKPIIGVSHHLLISNMFSHLKILDLALSHNSLTLLSPSFIHAPNLIHLTLKGYPFIYNEVEKFDKSFPSLKTVKFWIYLPIDRTLPADIKPNFRITCVHFKVKNVKMTEQILLLRYISKKYKNLTGFTYDSGIPVFNQSLSHESPSSIDLSDNLLSTIVHQGPQLKTLKVLCTRLDFSHLAMPIMQFQLAKSKMDFTRTSPEKLFHKNTLSTSTFCRLSVLMVQRLSTSDFKWLEALDKLKVLKIKRPQIACLTLDSVMQHTSHTLETLVIKGCAVKVGQDYLTLGSHESSEIGQGDLSDYSDRIYPLKNLKLSNVRIKENVDHFISHACPGLQSLSIYTCSIVNLELRLPSIHLLHFNITKERPMYTNDKGEHWDYIWIHDEQKSWLWYIEHSQHNRHGLNYVEFYGFPGVPCLGKISKDALGGVDICHFTFASVKHIGASK